VRSRSLAHFHRNIGTTPWAKPEEEIAAGLQALSIDTTSRTGKKRA